MPMWLKWLPWRFVVKRVAKAHGFLDPIALIARLQSFLQPSEVAEPIELLRAGALMHARGLINSRVIQHNLDWVWPYWIERQFDPGDVSFVPRAFSITHINLTQRNWTAVGSPDLDLLPIVDPRGLLTPLYDGWSLDAWVIGRDGHELLPSRAPACEQAVALDDGFAICTRSRAPGLTLAQRADVVDAAAGARCRLELSARADAGGWLVLALRPYNPEGISFVHEVRLTSDRRGWQVDDSQAIAFDAAADACYVSDYAHGDVYTHLHDAEQRDAGVCDIGMLTAAALFRLEPATMRTLNVAIPLAQTTPRAAPSATAGWSNALQGHCRLELADATLQRLYDTAVRTLVLHSPGDVYPGPYTYKRFWFRDAAFMIHALLCAGFTARAERAIDRFAARQTRAGYFHSQDGEWDSNGEALWIMARYCQLSGQPPKPAWQATVPKAAEWIRNKRTDAGSGTLHAGLLPAGFSAEHLGPNDYYLWDDFWGVAGLEAASALCALSGAGAGAATFAAAAEEFLGCIDASLARAAARLGRAAMPASPYRRLDAGAIGSLAANYPLQVYPADDPRVLDTVDFLLERCFVDGAFFQDMTHSGLNAYLTLHVAQVLLAAGDPRYLELLDTVAALASPTGQWPEANHPRSGGGCMGDGQHAWAAAEWILMLRNCFVLEQDARLILGSGVAARWLAEGRPVRFGPAPTRFGTISLEIRTEADAVRIDWRAQWSGAAPEIEVRIPGWAARVAAPGVDSVMLDQPSPA